MSGWAPSLPTVSTKIRMLPQIQSTNNLAIQDVISSSSLNAGNPFLPFTGSPNPAALYMYLAAAPTNWTLVSGVSDCLLGIQGGSSQYSAAGGTVVGTWSSGPHVLTLAELPSVTAGVGSGAFTRSAFNNPEVDGSAHTHDWTTTRPIAAVGVLVTKDS